MLPSTSALFAIVAATLAYYAIGSAWFVALKDPYLAGLGKTAKQMKNGPSIAQASVLHLLCALAMTFIIFWILTEMHVHGVVEAVQAMGVLWLGFVACIIGPMYAYQAYSLQFFLINALYHLLGFMAIGVILGIVV